MFGWALTKTWFVLYSPLIIFRRTKYHVCNDEDFIYLFLQTMQTYQAEYIIDSKTVLSFGHYMVECHAICQKTFSLTDDLPNEDEVVGHHHYLVKGLSCGSVTKMQEHRRINIKTHGIRDKKIVTALHYNPQSIITPSTVGPTYP